MSMTTETAKTITWIRGSDRYTSTCGRFTILRANRPRTGWVLFDHYRKDVCVPEYTWTCPCVTIVSAKHYAMKALSA